MSGRQRGIVDLSIGTRVLCDDTIYEISQIIDYNAVVGTELATGRARVLRVADLAPVQEAGAALQEIEELDPAALEAARFRLDAIKPLLTPGTGRKQVVSRAEEIGVHYATLYRWLSRYEAGRTLASLIPKRQGRKPGETRLPAETEAIIQSAIEDVYLTRQRVPAQKVVLEVRRRCLEAGLNPPHANTVRARIAAIHPGKRMRRRGQKKAAEEKYKPVPGTFPGADYPLACIQIDHTPVDIVLVDDIYRLPIGRPWITLAIDVFSRMVAGMYLSFDAPSETSVAMCVSHAVLPKDEWLTVMGVEAEWPCYGIMDTIHVDNAAEFRSSGFRDACAMHGINLEYRPVRQPRFGGHIERLLGTFLKEIHQLPGTTFSSVQEREEYDSEKHAVMTKSEFEKWLVTLICKVYHTRLHAGIGMSPLKKWELGLFGTEHEPGRGLPKIPSDRLAFLLDFLPRQLRTIQPRGVTIEGLTYYADVLRPWIGAMDPQDPKRKRRFTFRRDPRDISVAWFFDPELQQYFRVPFANQALPSMSIWEYRKARNKLRKEGEASVNEQQILEAITELREQVRQAASRSKKARRQLQNRQEHAKTAQSGKAAAAGSESEPAPDLPQQDNINRLVKDLGPIDDSIFEDVKPFDEIE